MIARGELIRLAAEATVEAVLNRNCEKIRSLLGQLVVITNDNGLPSLADVTTFLNTKHSGNYLDTVSEQIFPLALMLNVFRSAMIFNGFPSISDMGNEYEEFQKLWKEKLCAGFSGFRLPNLPMEVK